MKVFISWSGEPSRTFAETLGDWLPTVIQSVRPFLSSNDIRSGQRWFSEIGKELQNTKFGILCLTPSNKEAPWILFEAGAISKIVDESHVVPLLIGLEKSQITAPLSQFQARSVSKDEISKLIQDMNRLSDNPIDVKRLGDIFTAFWPKLETAIASAEKEAAAPVAQPKRRSNEEMTEEILVAVRSMGSNLEHMKTLVAESQMGIQNGVVGSSFTFTPTGIPFTISARPAFTAASTDLGLAINPANSIPGGTIQASPPGGPLVLQVAAVGKAADVRPPDEKKPPK